MPERAVGANNYDPFTAKEVTVGDFFAPFFTIRFITEDPQQGTKVDGATGADEPAILDQGNSIVFNDGETRLRFSEDGRTTQFRSYVTELTVTNQAGASSLELRLEPPLEDALKIIEQRVVQFNSLLVVEWGWTSRASQEAYISDKHYFWTMTPKLSVSNADVSITITGMDILGFSATRRETRRTYSRVGVRKIPGSSDQWERLKGNVYDTDFKILEALAQKNNLRLNTTLAPQTIEKTVVVGSSFLGPITVPLVVPTNLPIHTKRPANAQEPDAVEQNEQDWLFFRRICDMNRLDFFSIGNTVFLVDQNIARVREFAYRLVFWNQPQGARDIPIFSFSTDALETFFAPAAAASVQSSYANEDEGTTTLDHLDPQNMSDLEALGPRGAGGEAQATGRTIPVSDDVQIIPNPIYAEDEVGQHISTPSGASGRDEHAKRVVREANVLANQSMKVTIPGVPGLVPMQLVRVDGVSRVFGGPYLVMRVVHKLTTSGYECDVDMIRESSTGDGEAGRGQRPVTGGNNPGAAPDGQGVNPVTAEET